MICSNSFELVRWKAIYYEYLYKLQVKNDLNVYLWRLSFSDSVCCSSSFWLCFGFVTNAASLTLGWFLKTKRFENRYILSSTAVSIARSGLNMFTYHTHTHWFIGQFHQEPQSINGMSGSDGIVVQCNGLAVRPAPERLRICNWVTMGLTPSHDTAGEPLWVSCSHTCASDTEQYNLASVISWRRSVAVNVSTMSGPRNS